MNLRKNRVPLQGLCNRHPINQPSQHHSRAQSLGQTSKSGFFQKQKTRSQIKVKGSATRRAQLPENQSLKKRMQQMRSTQFIDKIQEKFSRKNNIYKILKAWKFDSKGHITEQQLRSNLQKIMKINLSNSPLPAELSTLLQKDNTIGVKEFFRLIYKKPESCFFQKRLFETNQWNQQRNKKIIDLTENLQQFSNFNTEKNIQSMNDREINETIKHGKRAVSKIKNSIPQNGQSLNLKQKQAFGLLHNIFNKQPDSQNMIEPQVYNQTRIISRFSKTEKFLNKKKLFQTCKTQNNFFSKANFFGLTSKCNSSLKTDQFNPKSMLGINQAKTRFGSTPFKDPLVLGNDKIEHKSTLVHIRDEQQKQKNYKENRLQKIRKYLQKEKENTIQLDKKLEQKDNNYLRRKKYDKQAYQYVTFLKNKWD